VQRVIDAAAAHGIAIDVREYPEGTHTAGDAAAAVGVGIGQIVKSLAFVVDGTIVVALVSGSNRLDEAALAAITGGSTVLRADADAVHSATGFAIGGVPPFGHPTPLPTYVDRGLLPYDVVWAAAGSPKHVFPIAPDDLVRATNGTVADLKAP